MPNESMPSKGSNTVELGKGVDILGVNVTFRS